MGPLTSRRGGRCVARAFTASLTCLRQLAQQQPAAMMNYGETVEEQLFAQMDDETTAHGRAELGYVVAGVAAGKRRAGTDGRRESGAQRRVQRDECKETAGKETAGKETAGLPWPFSHVHLPSRPFLFCR